MASQPPPSDPMSADGAFVVTKLPNYLLIEAIGHFNVEAARVATEHAARFIRVPGVQHDIITDFTMAYVAGREVHAIISEYARGNRPYVRRSAVIGLSGIKRFFFDLVLRLSGRDDLRPFKTREAAEAWLAQP